MLIEFKRFGPLNPPLQKTALRCAWKSDNVRSATPDLKWKDTTSLSWVLCVLFSPSSLSLPVGLFAFIAKKSWVRTRLHTSSLVNKKLRENKSHAWPLQLIDLTLTLSHTHTYLKINLRVPKRLPKVTCKKRDHANCLRLFENLAASHRHRCTRFM